MLVPVRIKVRLQANSTYTFLTFAHAYLRRRAGH
jgi:hypothetical protein